MMKEEKFVGWDAIDASAVSPEETEKAFREVMRRSLVLESYLEKMRYTHKLKVARVLSVAAIALILLVPFAAWFFAARGVASRPEADATLCQLSTVRGEDRDVLLPDGTQVHLNASSLLVYPEPFGATRQVFLSGEAVFDVTSSPEHPFFVRTGDLTVRVFGTRFDVKAYPEDGVAKTTLERGKVSVWPNDNPARQVDLSPAQQFSYEKKSGAITTRSVRIREEMAWENGGLCFTSASLRDIVCALERQYDLRINLDERYDSTVITAHFLNGESPDEMLEALCAVVPHMRYTREGNVVTIL